MDKSWICEISLNKEKYIREVIDFLDFPFERSSKDEKILFGNSETNVGLLFTWIYLRFIEYN